jgi:hypothetical protein
MIEKPPVSLNKLDEKAINILSHAEIVPLLNKINEEYNYWHQ